MSPISVYIRTLNEERRIAQVLEAAKKLSDDVIIIDSGSSDKTLEIASSLGVRVIEQTWLGNGKQKRIGEDAAKFDWVLDIDADEVLTDEFINEVTDVFRESQKNSTIFSFRLVTVPPVGKPWYGFDNVRRHKLYNRTYIRVPDHAAWDQLDIPKDASVLSLKHPVLHYSFKDLSHLLRKQNRVSTVRAYETPLKSKHYIISVSYTHLTLPTTPYV